VRPEDARPEGANFDCPAFCPHFVSIFSSYASVTCSDIATGRTGGTSRKCPAPYLGQTRSSDSRKSEEKVRGTLPDLCMVSVVKFSTEDGIGLLITDYRMVLCMVFGIGTVA
jgi:hypothetical protein